MVDGTTQVIEADICPNYLYTYKDEFGNFYNRPVQWTDDSDIESSVGSNWEEDSSDEFYDDPYMDLRPQLGNSDYEKWEDSQDEDYRR